ncbi:MAG TPA: UbiA family prenyltransferase [Marmoricola sp.]|nr:UbiA family prenyltransferase [Marmoricola sp.]
MPPVAPEEAELPSVLVSTPRQRRAERKGPAKIAKAERKLSAKSSRARLKQDKKTVAAQIKIDKADAKAHRKLEPKPSREPIRPLYQFFLILRSAHLLQAVIMAIVIGIVAASDNRGVGGTLVAAAGVLLTQLALGLLNDAYDEKSDARGDRERKPVASGALPKGNATYAALVLGLASIPVAALNGTIAGAALLLTLPVGFLHNRILHRTPASFLGWMVTFPLLVAYLAYGGWGAGKHSNTPTWQLLVAAAALGLVCHFLTALPDLASDHKAGLAELPLVIARRTGATVLLIATAVCLVAAIAVMVWCGLHFGIRQR